MIRVGIVDDHPIVLDGLAAALDRQADIGVAWRAGSLAEARQAVAAGACDVVLVDVRLPDGSGLELIERGDATPAFLVLSSFDQPQYARAAYQRGASGYLLKVAPIEDIVTALHAVAAGGTAFAPNHLAALTNRAELSPREVELVGLVAQGYSNDEIAARMSLSRKTVEAYLGRLYARWEVASRTELALRAERDGWLDPAASMPSGD
jgi:DNA-binding NarL/FixJ family response regulator